MLLDQTTCPKVRGLKTETSGLKEAAWARRMSFFWQQAATIGVHKSQFNEDCQKVKKQEQLTLISNSRQE